MPEVVCRDAGRILRAGWYLQRAYEAVVSAAPGAGTERGYPEFTRAVRTSPRPGQPARMVPDIVQGSKARTPPVMTPISGPSFPSIMGRKKNGTPIGIGTPFYKKYKRLQVELNNQPDGWGMLSVSVTLPIQERLAQQYHCA